MTIKLTRLDLDYILTQIQMAEAGQVPVNPLLSFGLREVAGTNNNLAAGPEHLRLVGCSRSRRITDPMFQNAQSGTVLCADQRAGRGRAPRTISVLVASQNAKAERGRGRHLGTADDAFVSGNAAAFAAQQTGLSFLAPATRTTPCPARTASTAPRTTPARPFAGPDGILGTADDIMTFGNPATPTNASAAARPVPAWRRACSSPTSRRTRPVRAGQQLLHVLRPVLRSRPGPDHQERQPTARSSFRCSPDDPLYKPGAPHQLHGGDPRAGPARPGRHPRHRRRRAFSTSTRHRRSSTRARPTAPTRRTRCSCAST